MNTANNDQRERYLLGATVVRCPECGHGIDPHGTDPGGICGVGDENGVPCECLMSPNGIACALLDAAESDRVKFMSALGFGDNVSEPAATFEQAIDPIQQAFAEANEHAECAVICEGCGERLAQTICDRCGGGGCLPNPQMTYLECDHCAGVGRVHAGCAGLSYAELAAKVPTDD